MIGNRPTIMPVLISICTASSVEIPIATSRPNGSAGGRRNAQPAPAPSATNKRQQQCQSPQAEPLAQHAGDRIGMRLPARSTRFDRVPRRHRASCPPSLPARAFASPGASDTRRRSAFSPAPVCCASAVMRERCSRLICDHNSGTSRTPAASPAPNDAARARPQTASSTTRGKTRARSPGRAP